MIPLFWFMGIHGPSVVKPALNAALFGNITTNSPRCRPAVTPPSP